jgi:hypothetical protein
LKAIRLFFEVSTAKDLVYVKVTLPKADSKLDKEKETKKDFKEKTSMMTMFYKAIHKISDAGLKDTVLDKIFDHSKISFELIYENGEVGFYIVTYANYIEIITQHITSIYTDAEVKIVDRETEYVDLKPY